MTVTTMPALADLLFAPDAIEIYVQPIIHFDGGGRRIHSLECLARGPAATHLRRAGVLFEYVRRKHLEAAVDRLCVSAAFEAMNRIPAYDFAVNVHASTLATDACFAQFLFLEASARGIDPRRITVEITEQAGVADLAPFLENLESLRAVGIRIALDDIGAGLSNYDMILDARPELFKIDRYIIDGCSGDPRRMAIVETLQLLASRLGGVAVAEGVERDEDLRAVRDAGISLVQGFLLGRPVAAADFALRADWT